MKKTIDQWVTDILANPKPVILLDTCALLDIVRAPDREDILPAVISAASTLSSDNSKWLISSKTVSTEWNDNIDNVEIGVRNSLKNLHSRAIRYRDSVQHSPLPEKWKYNNEILDHQVEKKLRAISSKLLSATLLIEDDPECINRAYQRIINSIPPSSKGKSEMKDCSIIEHYIELGQKLKKGGFSKPIIFVSSNKNDFGSPYDTKEPIKTEFSTASIQYVSDLASVERCCKQ